MRRLWVSLFSCLFVLCSLVNAYGELAPGSAGGAIPAPGFVGYVPDRIVVKFDESVLRTMSRESMSRGQTGVFALDELAARYHAVSMRPQFPGARKAVYRERLVNLAAWHAVQFAEAVDIARVVREYRRSPGVLDAQPIGIHVVYRDPNDPRFPEQWHLNQANDSDIDAPEAWDIETGDGGIIVAILDTGVRYYHKDLGGAGASADDLSSVGGNMWVNEAERGGVAGVDDDGNGFVDDIVGWDFVEGPVSPLFPAWPGEDGDTADNDPRDFNSHGSHVSGIVAAINNNGYGVSSSAGGWGDGTLRASADGVRVMALRMGYSANYFGQEVGLVSMDAAARAFFYAADNGARIASCSWGSSNTGGIAEAIDYFMANGGLIFKAAGNSDNEQTDYMTAREDIISVAAAGPDDTKASFSSYGNWVDISAPGVDILSLYHNHDDPEPDLYAAFSGTSMATPLAASVAALIWSQDPNLTAEEVKGRLFNSADPIDELNPAYAGKLGVGRVNAYHALLAGPAGPQADFSGSPTSGCDSLTVNFTDQSTGDITSWFWDFGDGSTSAAHNPSHTYGNPGTYTVSLTVTGPRGTDTEEKENYVSIASAPGAQFSASSTSGPAPLAVGFTDESTGDPTAWSWDFGDGGTSTEQNPSHTYGAPGTYSITLAVENACGSDNETKADYITVEEPVANLMHVGSIEMGKQGFFFVITRGRATVTIMDAGGSPVPGARVTGQWSGSAADTDTFNTDANGRGVASSNWVFFGGEFTFCVTDVTKTDWTYDPGANVVTCASTGGS